MMVRRLRKMNTWKEHAHTSDLFTLMPSDHYDLDYYQHTCTRSCKHILELVYSKCTSLKKKCIQPNRTPNTLTVILYEQSCTDLAEILPPAPTAQFCASPVDNSTTFSILQLGILHGNQYFSPLPGYISAFCQYLQIPGWFVYLLE